MRLGICFMFWGVWLSIWGSKLGGHDAVFLISSIFALLVGGLVMLRRED